STDPITLGLMVSRAVQLPFSAWVQSSVLSPMGAARDGLYVQDRSGDGMADSGARLRVEDWIRFALWVKRSSKEEGCFGDFVRDAMRTEIYNCGTSTTRKFGKLFGGYGYLMWTENEIARDTVWAVGYGGQRIGWHRKSERMLIVFSNVEDWMPEVYELAKEWFRIPAGR
ncbi:MAG: serine hydrolase, partial [Burkholderiaceae bacterium]